MLLFAGQFRQFNTGFFTMIYQNMGTETKPVADGENGPKGDDGGRPPPKTGSGK